MTRHRATIVAIALAAVGSCLLGVTNASATTLHECLHQAGTATEYTSSTCKTQGSGGFHTVRLGPGRHSGKLTFPSTTTLSNTIAGVKFKISCTGGSGTAEVENIGSGATSQVLGSSINISLEGCSVTEPAGKGCTVASTIPTKPLESETPMETTKVNYLPESGSTFVEFSVSGCSITLLNGIRTVTGKAVAEYTEAEPLIEEFTATTGSELRLAGQNTTFISQKKLDTTDGTPIAEELP